MTVFGPLVGPIAVEKAVLATLRTWLGAYLYDLETKEGLQHGFLLRPPAPESYHGGLDWQSVKQDRCPEVITICKPVGEPERQSSAYMQNFRVQVGCVVFSEEGPNPEDAARQRASLFATATLLLVQQPPGSFEETVLVGGPDVEFFDPDDRRVAVGITTWAVYAEILQPSAGPVTVKEVEPEGPYPESPEAKTQKEIVTAEPVTEAIH